MIKFASDEVAMAAKDPIAAEALDARARLDEAFAAQDTDTVSALCAKDLVVNTPANRVARLEALLGFFRAGRMNYDSLETTIEALDARVDHVVIMGEEVVKPRDTAPNAGKTVGRRYTDIWRRESDGTVAPDRTTSHDHICRVACSDRAARRALDRRAAQQAAEADGRGLQQHGRPCSIRIVVASRAAAA